MLSLLWCFSSAGRWLACCLPCVCRLLPWQRPAPAQPALLSRLTTVCRFLAGWVRDPASPWSAMELFFVVFRHGGGGGPGRPGWLSWLASAMSITREDLDGRGAQQAIGGRCRQTVLSISQSAMAFLFLSLSLSLASLVVVAVRACGVQVLPVFLGSKESALSCQARTKPQEAAISFN